MLIAIPALPLFLIHMVLVGMCFYRLAGHPARQIWTLTERLFWAFAVLITPLLGCVVFLIYYSSGKRQLSVGRGL